MPLVVILVLVVWIAAFVDAITSDADRVRVMPKAIWVILILLFAALAGLAWFIFGRPRGAGAPGTRGFGTGFGSSGANGGSSGARLSQGGFTRPSAPAPQTDDAAAGWQLGGTGGRRRSGPLAPDDDPEFLRQLGKRRRPDDGPGTTGDGASPDQPA